MKSTYLFTTIEQSPITHVPVQDVLFVRKNLSIDLFRPVEPRLLVADLVFIGALGIGHIPSLHRSRFSSVHVVRSRFHSTAVSRFHVVARVGEQIERFIEHDILSIFFPEIIAWDSILLTQIYPYFHFRRRRGVCPEFFSSILDCRHPPDRL